MPRSIVPDDWLYRIVREFDNHVDSSTGIVHPAAFEDRYEKLSLYVARASSPIAIYTKFAGFKKPKQLCGTTENPSPKQMHDVGYRITRIKADIILSNGFCFEVDQEGNEFDINGHSNVLQGQDGSIIWAKNASTLSIDESLSNQLGLTWK
jgi:hypothetical protein